MTSHPHYETAPEDRIPLHHKIIYGFGAFTNNLLASAIGGMVIVLNLGFGMSPALVGLLGSLPRLTDALTDPLMGYISDHTRSRWGRRRPYIFVGAIVAGLIYILLWRLPSDASESFYFWYFLAGSLVFFLAYTIFVTPWVALGYELTPDYHERTRLMGVQNFIGQTPYLIAPWFLWIMQNERMFDDMREGAAGLALAIGVVVIIMGIQPAIFLRERFVAGDFGQESDKRTLWENVIGFLKGFAMTIKFKPFQKLCIATFLVFNGFITIAAFQFYVIIYYLFAGDVGLGSEFAGYEGTVRIASGFLIIPFVIWLGTKIGKRRTFFVATGISIFGYAIKWVCYNPDQPWLILLPAPFISFGFASLFTLMPSMVADVVDADELVSRERREGMYGSIFWWVVKLGQAVALAVGGFLLTATGFDVALEGNQAGQTILLIRLFDILIPIAASAIAIWIIASYSITEERAHQVRLELEQRRGTLGDAAAQPA
ncbi:MAG: MFS transporter [Woeseiaceae bacterium]|nr:MFS transporter [Woeseiaceae bacterium]